MPDQPEQNFEQAIEQDIERLTVEVKMREGRPETQGISGQEVIKRSIQTMTQQAPSDVSHVAEPQNVFQNPLPDYAQSAPAEVKLEIEHLLETAFREGIYKANSEAAKSSAFVMDAFHDALAGKLYPELKKRGIVE